MKVIRTDVLAHLEQDDVTTLLNGRPLRIRSLHGGEGGEVTVSYTVPREVLQAVGQNVIKSLQALTNGAAPLALPAPKEKAATIYRAAGPCPYCERVVKHLAMHVKHIHPGKMVFPDGAYECQRCHERYPSEISMRNHHCKATGARKARRTKRP